MLLGFRLGFPTSGFRLRASVVEVWCVVIGGTVVYGVADLWKSCCEGGLLLELWVRGGGVVLGESFLGFGDDDGWNAVCRLWWWVEVWGWDGM